MILLRHGQSEFNVRFTATRIDPGIRDAPLTELGHLQARRAAEALKGERVTRIIVSPYTRALQTAGYAARALGAPVFVNPVVRERFAFSCDIGTPRTELALHWPEHDFSGIEEVWWSAMEELSAAVAGRAARFLGEMAALHDWSDTLVVSHWGFIMACTGQTLTNGRWLRHDPTRPPSAE